ncbi:class I SAM-dependent methyltransferase [Novipirellula caenicola]|uniref:Methyltransferase type 11 domain-containing protein n=1 Tax=Novipirellula caenicola TaxID=1536901 RepID=A0ABP9VU82_9BACT
MATEDIHSNILSEQQTIEELIRDYQTTQSAIRWPIEAELEAAVKVSYRNQLATQLAHESAEVISRRYVYMTDAAMSELVDLVEQKLLKQPLHGYGIELGSGCALLAAVAAKRENVKAVLGLEVCENFDVLIEIVAASVLGDDAAKVIPVIGSFDDLKIPDNSLDFAVEHDSLHHSDDLPRSMTECARVLKPGGVLICFDRCHPNSVTDDDVNALLDHVYSTSFLKANGYPTDIVLTRRDNGEHEYRLFEWQAAAKAAALDFTHHCEFHKRITFKKAAKGLLSLLPKPIGKKLGAKKNTDIGATHQWVSQRLNATRSNHASILAPKQTTVMVFTKPK